MNQEEDWSKLGKQKVSFIHKDYESSDDEGYDTKTLDQGSEWTRLGKQKSSFIIKTDSVESDDEIIPDIEIEQW